MWHLMPINTRTPRSTRNTFQVSPGKQAVATSLATNLSLALSFSHSSFQHFMCRLWGQNLGDQQTKQTNKSSNKIQTLRVGKILLKGESLSHLNSFCCRIRARCKEGQIHKQHTGNQGSTPANSGTRCHLPS